MKHIIEARNAELYHHGVKGMKWGVRRYQNADGSLTPAGKKRMQKDADKLTKGARRLYDSFDAYRKTTSIHYVVDKSGANSYSKDGKPIFDAGRQIRIYNTKKAARSNKLDKKLTSLENLMKKKYDSVKFEGSFHEDTGKARARYIVEKNGHKTVSEFVKDYGEYKIPMKFIEY